MSSGTNLREIAFARPMIGKEEKDAVERVLSGPILVHGDRCRQFEADFASYTGAPHAVTVSSCTAGLHLSYFNLGLGEGDEVIVPAQTHVATAHAVELCGAKPVFVDAESATGNIDIDRIEDAITERTRALSVVHFLGMPVNMDRINAIGRKHDLFVVEDCALAIGTYFNGVHAGLLGDVGSFSFYPVKHMTTAEGGMVTTKDSQIAERITRQKAFGVDRFVGERKVPGQYDVTMLGYNYRLNELQCAMGIEQLKRVDGFLERRREHYGLLEKGLRDIGEIGIFESSHDEYVSSCYCLSILLSEELSARRIEMIGGLKARGVGTSIYYPRAVPEMSYYAEKYGYSEGSYPVASMISSSSIALPVGPHLCAEDMQYIVDSLKSVIFEVK